jgi:hypothetical protein
MVAVASDFILIPQFGDDRHMIGYSGLQMTVTNAAAIVYNRPYCAESGHPLDREV